MKHHRISPQEVRASKSKLFLAIVLYNIPACSLPVIYTCTVRANPMHALYAPSSTCLLFHLRPCCTAGLDTGGVPQRKWLGLGPSPLEYPDVDEYEQRVSSEAERSCHKDVTLHNNCMHVIHMPGHKYEI